MGFIIELTKAIINYYITDYQYIILLISTIKRIVNKNSINIRTFEKMY